MYLEFRHFVDHFVEVSSFLQRLKDKVVIDKVKDKVGDKVF